MNYFGKPQAYNYWQGDQLITPPASGPAYPRLSSPGPEAFPYSAPNNQAGGSEFGSSGWGDLAGMGTLGLTGAGIASELLTGKSLWQHAKERLGIGEAPADEAAESARNISPPPGSAVTSWPRGLAPGPMTAGDAAFLGDLPAMGTLASATPAATAPYMLTSAPAGLGTLGMGSAGTAPYMLTGADAGFGTLGAAPGTTAATAGLPSMATAALPAAVAAFIAYKGLTMGSEDDQATQFAQAQQYGNIANDIRSRFINDTWEPDQAGDPSMFQSTLRQLLDGGYSMPFTMGGERTGNGIPNTVMAKPIPRDTPAYKRAASALLDSSQANIGDYWKYVQPEIAGDGSNELAQYRSDVAKYGGITGHEQLPDEQEIMAAYSRYMQPEIGGEPTAEELTMLRALGRIPEAPMPGM